MKSRIIKALLALLCLLGISLNVPAASTVGSPFINGDWEAASPDGWVQYPVDANHTLEVSTSGAHGGAQCGKLTIKAGAITDPAQKSGWVQERVWGPMQVNGTRLRFSGWVKTAWAADAPKRVTLNQGTKNGTGWNTIYELDAESGDLTNWTFMAGDFTVEGGPATVPTTFDTGSFLSVRVSADASNSTGDSIIYMDDFALEPSVAPDPSNLLKNPGFELGDDGSWQFWPTTTGITTSIVTDAPHGGTQALKVEYPEVTTGYAYQYYNGDRFYKGSTLRFSAWVKADFANQYGWVALYRDIAINDAWGNYFGAAARIDGDVPTWTLLSGDLELPAGPDLGTAAPATDYLALRLAGDCTSVASGTSTVYWDDARLQVTSVDPTNLLSNPGFELGLNGWSLYPSTNGIALSITTDNPKEGLQALKVVYPAGKDGIVYQYYRGAYFYVGSKLHVSAWVKTNFPDGNGWASIYHDIAINDAWGNYFGRVEPPVNGNQSEWFLLEQDLELPVGPAQGTQAPTTDYFTVRLAADATLVTSGDSTVYWDDTRLSVPGVAPTPNAARCWELY